MPKAFVVGHPIAHSCSPMIHGFWLAELGLVGSYERIDVAPEQFGKFIEGLRDACFAGGNVTIPHKEAAFRLVDTMTLRAQKIGAVNTIVIQSDGNIHGENTDALGFIAHVDQILGCNWLDRSALRVTILGAGGAARAIAVGLLERGVGRIRVANRTIDRASALAAVDQEHMEPLAWIDLPQALEETDFLINTTSLGMHGHTELNLDLDALPSTAAVADIVYVPLETALLAKARRRGLAVVDGLGMLLHQAVPGFEAWFGIRPAVTSDLRNLIVTDLTR